MENDKLVRLSDVDDILARVFGYAENEGEEIAVIKINDELKKLPAVDAVEVVRCREGRYFCKGENDAESWEWCDAWKKDCWSDCYCSQGQRREDGDV